VSNLNIDSSPHLQGPFSWFKLDFFNAIQIKLMCVNFKILTTTFQLITNKFKLMYQRHNLYHLHKKVIGRFDSTFFILLISVHIFIMNSFLNCNWLNQHLNCWDQGLNLGYLSRTPTTLHPTTISKLLHMKPNIKVIWHCINSC